MPNELGDDPRKVWQNQPTEISTMTLKLIRSKARELQSKTRRSLAGLTAGPLVAALMYAFWVREFPSQGYLLHTLFASALLWSLVGLYVLSRGMASMAFPENAGLSASVEFCRAEIERRRNLLRRVLVWSLGPILLALGTLILALAMIAAKDRRLFPNGLPFLIVLAAWAAGYFIKRACELRELKHEIDELNDLELDHQR